MDRCVESPVGVLGHVIPMAEATQSWDLTMLSGAGAGDLIPSQPATALSL